MEDLKQFPDSNVYKNKFGQILLQENWYSSALYMKLYAHEIFPTFKEAMSGHFSDRKSRRWVINYDFQSNCVKIWEQICGFQKISVFNTIRDWVLNLWYASS